MRRFNSGPRLQVLPYVRQGDTRFGRATVSESVSRIGRGSRNRRGDRYAKLFRSRVSRKSSPQNCYEFSVFFTDTLEFIFAASDLIEAGWDIEKWISRGTTMSHPFGRYRVNYEANLNHLKEEIALSTTGDESEH